MTTAEFRRIDEGLTAKLHTEQVQSLGGGSTYQGPGDRPEPIKASVPAEVGGSVGGEKERRGGGEGGPITSTEGMVHVQPIYAEQHPEAVVEIDGKYYRPAISASQSKEAKLVGLSSAELYAKTLEDIKSGEVAFGSVSSAKSGGKWSREVKARGVELERRQLVNEARESLFGQADEIRDARMAILDPLQEEAKARGTTNPLGEAWAALSSEAADKLQRGIETEESIRRLASDIRGYSFEDVKDFLEELEPVEDKGQKWWVVAAEGDTFRFGGLNFRPELLKRPGLDTFELKPKKSRKEGILSTRISGSAGLYNKGRQHVPTIVGSIVN